MEWIAEVDRIDKLLHSLGVPDAHRMKAVGEIATILTRAENERRKAERDREAARLLPRGASVVAELQQCHRVTAYRRAARAKVVAPKIPTATS